MEEEIITLQRQLFSDPLTDVLNRKWFVGKYLVKFLKNELKFPGLDIVRYAGNEFLLLFNKERAAIVNVEKIVSEA